MSKTSYRISFHTGFPRDVEVWQRLFVLVAKSGNGGDRSKNVAEEISPFWKTPSDASDDRTVRSLRQALRPTWLDPLDRAARTRLGSFPTYPFRVVNPRCLAQHQIVSVWPSCKLCRHCPAKRKSWISTVATWGYIRMKSCLKKRPRPCGANTLSSLWSKLITETPVEQGWGFPLLQRLMLFGTHTYWTRESESFW